MTNLTSNSSNINKSGYNPRYNWGKAWLLLPVGFLIIASGIYFYYRPYINSYIFNLRYNPFKFGDKIYAAGFNVNDSNLKSLVIHFYQKIDPVDNNGKVKVIPSPWGISTDSLYKMKTACIGTYVKTEIISIKYKDKYIPAILYFIKPIKAALVNDATDGTYHIPQNYIQDSTPPFYVMYYETTTKESTTSRSLNK